MSDSVPDLLSEPIGVDPAQRTQERGREVLKIAATPVAVHEWLCTAAGTGSPSLVDGR
jgi:hypothetical protein